jgi:hypothetical protein
MRKRLGLFVAAAASAVCVTTLGLAPSAVADPPSGPDESTARAELAQLTVATPDSMDGYSRDAFSIWASQPDGCTTRQEVLKRDGKDVVDSDGDCQPESGSWYSAYDGTTQTVVAQATIDHMVPLAEAWRSGADKWTAAQRKAFGNHLDDPQLIVASESSNSSKSDSGPADWKPENKDFWCTYGEDYTAIKYKFKLTTTDAEVSALGSMLDTCS